MDTSSFIESILTFYTNQNEEEAKSLKAIRKTFEKAKKKDALTMDVVETIYNDLSTLFKHKKWTAENSEINLLGLKMKVDESHERSKPSKKKGVKRTTAPATTKAKKVDSNDSESSSEQSSSDDECKTLSHSTSEQSEQSSEEKSEAVDSEITKNCVKSLSRNLVEFPYVETFLTKLFEWTDLSKARIVFDSEKDAFDTFSNKAKNKANICFIFFDDQNNVFGAFSKFILKTAYNVDTFHDRKDTSHFIFTVSNGDDENIVKYTPFKDFAMSETDSSDDDDDACVLPGASVLLWEGDDFVLSFGNMSKGYADLSPIGGGLSYFSNLKAVYKNVENTMFDKD
ncbi:hypothetical protein EIN_252100, partial [Entamoeba invadens IP1]